MAACNGIELVRSIYRTSKAHDKKEPLEEFLDNSKTGSEAVCGFEDTAGEEKGRAVFIDGGQTSYQLA